jgi:hypothetical protein
VTVTNEDGTIGCFSFDDLDTFAILAVRGFLDEAYDLMIKLVEERKCGLFEEGDLVTWNGAERVLPAEVRAIQARGTVEYGRWLTRSGERWWWLLRQHTSLHDNAATQSDVAGRLSDAVSRIRH